jgi:hypothetical protein
MFSKTADTVSMDETKKIKRLADYWWESQRERDH